MRLREDREVHIIRVDNLNERETRKGNRIFEDLEGRSQNEYRDVQLEEELVTLRREQTDETADDQRGDA